MGPAFLSGQPDSFAWGGQNVYDVLPVESKALDGTHYRDW
jgi:hypothetical protein